MEELKKLAEDLRTSWETEFVPRVEQMETESKSHGEAFAETKESIDRVQDRLDELETKLEKASLESGKNTGSEATKAFLGFLRSKSAEVPENYYDAYPESFKALALRDETLGGVLAPPEFVAEVIKGIVQYSPIRSIAGQRATSRTSIMFPKRTGVLAAQWTSEIGTRNETTGQTYGLEEIPTHELYARVLLSNWDLEDPVVDLEADVRSSMEEQFGVAEGAAFVKGTASGQPEGFTSAITGSGSADIELVNAGGATYSAAGADGLIKLAHQLKEQYWPGARYVMNRFTLRDVRLLKDTTNNYLWQPGVLGQSVALGLPPTLYGYPYTIAVDMPTDASNALAVAFGNFQKGYLIVDRLAVSVLRDPFTQANAGQVVIHARKRTGGQVVLPEAIKLQKMA